jgi:hypothetical protein
MGKIERAIPLTGLYRQVGCRCTADACGTRLFAFVARCRLLADGTNSGGQRQINLMESSLNVAIS